MLACACATVQSDWVKRAPAARGLYVRVQNQERREPRVAPASDEPAGATLARFTSACVPTPCRHWPCVFSQNQCGLVCPRALRVHGGLSGTDPDWVASVTRVWAVCAV